VKRTLLARAAGRSWRLPKGLALFFAGIALAWAGTSYTDLLSALAHRESSMNPASVNSETHYIGLFQMGEAALQDVGVYAGDSTRTNDWIGGWTGRYGVTSKAAFLADPQAQVQAETAYLNLIWSSYLVPQGAASYLGRTINGITVTQSGLVAAAHLVGAGNVLNWLRSNGGTVPADGNGTLMTEYLQRFAGYSLSPAAPAYAAVLAATPTGGVATIVTPSTPYSTPAPLVNAAPLFRSGGVAAPTYATAADGFLGATGYAMSDVRAFMTLLIGALILLWYARTLLSSWQGFSNGTLTLFGLNRNAVHGAIVVMLLVYLIW
jgi:hypothetical protein